MANARTAILVMIIMMNEPRSVLGSYLNKGGNRPRSHLLVARSFLPILARPGEPDEISQE